MRRGMADRQSLRRAVRGMRRLRPRLRPGFPWRQAHIPRGVEMPAHLSRTGANFDTDWARRWPARFVRAVIVEAGWRPIVAYYAKPRILGLDRLEALDKLAALDKLETQRGRPVIFVANHRSHADTPILLTSIPEPWRHKLMVGAAADYFFRNRAAGVLSAMGIGAIPIERQQPERRSAEDAAQLVSQGWSLLLYPEGGRSPDGWGTPFRAGAAWLASKCQVPVVPVFVAGTRSILRRGRKWPQQSPTAVIFGEPLELGPGERTREFNDRIERAVAALSDEFASDWWQARKRFHAGLTPPLSGPASSSWLRSWKHERVLRPVRSWPR